MAPLCCANCLAAVLFIDSDRPLHQDNRHNLTRSIIVVVNNWYSQQGLPEGEVRRVDLPARRGAATPPIGGRSAVHPNGMESTLAAEESTLVIELRFSRVSYARKAI